jgi:hypothetical protein
VAIGSAVFTAVMTSRQSQRDQQFKAQTDADLEELRHKLDTAARKEARSDATRDVLDTYRRPLLASAVQLAKRIENIRNRRLSSLSGGR